jgi:hypothetical protein
MARAISVIDSQTFVSRALDKLISIHIFSVRWPAKYVIERCAKIAYSAVMLLRLRLALAVQRVYLSCDMVNF